MRALLLALLLSAASAVTAQELNPALAPYAALIGDWAGPADLMTPSGPLSLHHTQTVRSDLEGHLLVVEGVSRAVGDDGAPGDISAGTLGVLSVNAATVYLDAFTMDDRHARVAPTPVEGGYDWTFEPGGQALVTYQMRFDDEGRWVETGRVSLDGGTSWQPFFEMTLSRVEAE
ncbi:hypothetical protein [Rubrivirga sp. IMCC45206]|uniref:hypothetical protein n=1 Tax=Rubrivirga sp. IMCC45206 TaxID=3391614 RepID=UPI003990242A